MKTASRHIICVIYAVLTTFCLWGQDDRGSLSDIDLQLNRYELICRECLELKKRVKAGEAISRNEAAKMIDSFVSMNAAIKASADGMSQNQKTRFEAISKWFSTGERPLVLSHIPLTGVIPYPVNTLLKSKGRFPDVACRKPEQNHACCEIEEKRLRTYILATLSLPDTSYGVMAGVQYGQWGGYIRAKSNFLFTTPSYSCYTSGRMDNGGPFWSNGKSRESVIAATVGALYSPVGWISLYGGLGYGHSNLYWQDIDDQWAEVKDHSFKGMAAEAGLLTSWKRLCLGLGVSTTTFRTANLDISFGISF